MKRLAYLVLFTVFLVGCSSLRTPPQEENVDLLSDKTCAAPCLLGIMPGSTTRADAQKIIFGNSLLVNCAEEGTTNSKSSRVQAIRCNGVLFVFIHNIVAWITISPANLDVEQVLQKYGIPSALSVESLSNPDEPFRSGVVFRYDQIRLQVNLVEKEGKSYEITPTTQVIYITYNDENGQQLLKKSVLSFWKGYGLYP